MPRREQLKNQLPLLPLPWRQGSWRFVVSCKHLKCLRSVDFGSHKRFPNLDSDGAVIGQALPTTTITQLERRWLTYAKSAASQSVSRAASCRFTKQRGGCRLLSCTM
jgi:hypothetical protein